MKDSHDGILYVGKAKNLKKRVQTYFQHSKSHSEKIKRLVKNIKNFEFILTDTEFDAFMLECSLIKKLKPIYNKKMKSPQSYTYIVIKMNEACHWIEIAGNPNINDGNLYFGPYPNKNSVERAIQGIKECFKINCSNQAKKNTACLNHSIGLCIGICLGGSAVEQYNSIINKIIALLNRTNTSILDEMNQKMLNASEKFDFETAAKYRDYIDSINSLIHKEIVIEFTEENKNIVIIESLHDSTIKLFLIKGNKVLFSEIYLLNDFNYLSALIKATILTHFNTEVLTPFKRISKDDIDEAQIIYSYLKGSNCRYLVIPEKWLDSELGTEVDESIDKLLKEVASE